jgi:hypothetical protein
MLHKTITKETKGHEQLNVVQTKIFQILKTLLKLCCGASKYLLAKQLNYNLYISHLKGFRTLLFYINIM